MGYKKFRPARGTKYEWETINPVLMEGEWVVEVPDSGVGTGLSKFKIGDGTNKYVDLPYAFDGTAAASFNGGNAVNYNLLQLRGTSAANWRQVNPVLAQNEIGYDETNRSFKIGDGSTRWNDLFYIKADSFVVEDYDFGDMDEEAIEATEEDVLDNSGYPDNILDDNTSSNTPSNDNTSSSEGNNTSSTPESNDDTSTEGN
jgi:hypothetical protein